MIFQSTPHLTPACALTRFEFGGTIIAAGALIFGQFLSDGRFNLRISVLGLCIFIVFIISSFHLSKNH